MIFCMPLQQSLEWLYKIAFSSFSFFHSFFCYCRRGNQSRCYKRYRLHIKQYTHYQSRYLWRLFTQWAVNTFINKSSLVGSLGEPANVSFVNQDVTYLHFRLVVSRSLGCWWPIPCRGTVSGQYLWTTDCSSGLVHTWLNLRPCHRLKVTRRFYQATNLNFAFKTSALWHIEGKTQIRRMSDFDSNPFADPDFSNPFQVTVAS